MCLFLFKYLHNEGYLTCLWVRTDVKTEFVLSDFIKMATDNQTYDVSHDIVFSEKWCQCLDKKSPGFQCCKAKFKYAYI
jgi:hypothetical protein